MLKIYWLIFLRAFLEKMYTVRYDEMGENTGQSDLGHCRRQCEKITFSREIKKSKSSILKNACLMVFKENCYVIITN